MPSPFTREFCNMHPNRLLPIFLLAIAGTDFLAAMHTESDGAAPSDAASSSITETKPHYHNVDYEGAIGSVRRVGSSGKPTEFIFVDTHEKKAVDHGPPHHLKLKNVQIRVGHKQLQSAIHKHKSPYAARIELMLDEQQNSDLNAPRDLEGIELEIVYGIGFDVKFQGIQSVHWIEWLSNGKAEKKVAVKIPKVENAPTEGEKDILKGIFIGGHKFRVEVQKEGNAEIKFQKNLSPGTMKFTADYTNFTSQKGELVTATYNDIVGRKYDLHFESVSLAESTFTMNWAASGIKEAEELRAITFRISFKLEDGKDKHRKLSERERGRKIRNIKLRNLNNGMLEQLFVGGEATIHLSSRDWETSKIEIGTVTAVEKTNDGI